MAKAQTFMEVFCIGVPKASYIFIEKLN